MKGGAKVIVEAHRHAGIFVARGKEDALVTLNATPGLAVYGEKRITVEVPPIPGAATTNPTKVEYRVWNPFRSKRTCSVVQNAIGCTNKPVMHSKLTNVFLIFSCCFSLLLSATE